MNRYNLITLGLIMFLMFFLIGCLKAHDNLAKNFKANSTLEYKLDHSNYDWSETKEVGIELTTPTDGMVSVRAVNGEILYQGFLANGILTEFVLNIPVEIKQVLIEYKDNQEVVSVGAKKVRFTF